MSLVESEEEIMRSVLQCLLILIIMAQAGASGAAPLRPYLVSGKTGAMVTLKSQSMSCPQCAMEKSEKAMQSPLL